MKIFIHKHYFVVPTNVLVESGECFSDEYHCEVIIENDNLATCPTHFLKVTKLENRFGDN